MNRPPLRALLVISIFLAAATASAQRDYDVWCIGGNTGISFAGPVPVPITSSINTFEGVAAIAHPVTGALLFYTDGVTVFNADHQPMPNGRGLKGDANSTQSALIVPVPGKPGTYYLFTADAGIYASPPNEGIHYSVIDMNLDGGRGDVTGGRVQLLPRSSERLTAVRHRDGCSFWVITHADDSDLFQAFLVDESGVASVPVESRVGTLHRESPSKDLGSAAIGSIKSSPDGRRLAVTIFSMGKAELFRFDDATGVVSDAVDLPVERDPYGASFSPDNSKLYISSQPASLVQFDLSNPDPAAIAASRHVLAHDSNLTTRNPYGLLQLAPDGRIYLARGNSRYVGVVGSPNLAGAACDYSLNGFDLGPGRHSWYGLPNLIDSYFSAGTLACGAPHADFTPENPDICVGDCLAFTDRSTNDPTSWSWTFEGAGKSGSAERNPSDICFDEPGLYRATLRVSNGAGSSMVTKMVRVRPRGELRVRAEGGIVAVPGDTITVPVMLDGGAIPPAAGGFTFTFRYRPGLMRFLDALVAGTLLEGWRVDSIEDDPVRGVGSFLLVPPAGEGLQGIGKILELRFATFLGWADSSTIGVEIGSPDIRCMNSVAEPGLVRLEYCGLGTRFIELTGADYALGDGRPNPFNPVTIIPFSLGLEGHATLTIHDVAGRRVATLVDGYLSAGAHRVSWDASAFPSGTYYCRLVSGEQELLRELVLRR